VAFKHVYDLAKHPLRIESIDAGLRRTVLDAMGNAIEGRDSKGALVLHAYDVLNRPIRLWARDDSNSAVTLRERLEYGDGSDKNQPVNERNDNRAANRLGKLYRHYDEAGVLTFATYDFKGNVLEKARQVISDAAILKVFEQGASRNWQVPAFRVDWQASNANTLLDITEYRTTISYDGLNRIKMLRYPQDVDGQRKELLPQYNRAGALESVALDDEIYVERIAYNAKGQRTLIVYGNGVMTRYAYDPQTFRLVRLRTERYNKPDPLTYRPTGAALQDFGYEYDLAGNILAIHDRTPGSGVPNSLVGIDALNREFSYDPIYRLLTATGREHATAPPDVPWRDEIKTQDPTLTRGYTEKYQYDSVGNILQMQHAANGGSFTREFTLVPNKSSPINNRLATVTIGATTYNYEYDVNGNLIRESTSRHFEWDHTDRMKVYRTQTGNAEPSVHAHYLYDAAGQRVKKLVRKQGGDYDVTIYIDGLFEYHRRVKGGTTQENNTLHVMDNQSRIALVRVGKPFDEDKTPDVKFHLGDHLGSSNVVIDDNGDLINREEYTPYGETSFGSFVRKRYRYTGKERDEESGLYYHGARYYAPWVTRWVSCDPAGAKDSMDLYAYVSNSPINHIDPLGSFKIGSPISPPTHEAITSRAAARALEKTSAKLTFVEMLGFTRGLKEGSRWPDMPEGIVKAGSVLGAEGKVKDAEKSSLTYRTHFGDLQYWHSMSSAADKSAVDVRNKIIAQTSEWYDQGIKHFASGKYDEAGKELGKVLHMVQDSWSPAHVARDPKTGRIAGFQNYSLQDSAKHGEVDNISVNNWEAMAKRPGVTQATDVSQQLISDFLTGDKQAFMRTIEKNYELSPNAYVNKSEGQFRSSPQSAPPPQKQLKDDK
jgi:RHS repeat-associated protein